MKFGSKALADSIRHFLSKLKEQQMNEMECEGHYFGFHLLFDFRAKSSKNDCNTS